MTPQQRAIRNAEEAILFHQAVITYHNNVIAKLKENIEDFKKDMT